ncbi:MAG: PqqD family protein [Thermoleophilaceae bacterium]|nr:PqqD family protein [Thermoleophilaceae bacterium]
MTVSFASRATVPSHVTSRRLDDELVLLNLDSESYFGLDAVGTRIWELISSSPTLAEAYRQLLSEYDVTEAPLREDMEKLLAQLVDSGLIELRPA